MTNTLMLKFGCVLLILLAQATMSQETTSLYFHVIAPETKTDGTPWEPGEAGGLPDIFVCFRATTRRWDCAPPCQDSRECAGKLNVVPVGKPLTIGVFDRDIQQNDPMYNLNIKDALRCTSGDGNPCRFAYGGRIAVTLSNSPVPETLYGGAGDDTLQDDSCTKFGIIFLHGRADSGTNWKKQTREDQDLWGTPDNLEFEFPNGPLTEGSNFKWYNIDDGDITEADVEEAESIIKGIIQEQKAKWSIPSGCIVLAGHSQGAAMALHTGLRLEEDLLGILTLTAAMRPKTPFGDQTDTWKADKSMPIFMSHGICDTHPWSGREWGRKTWELIEGQGYDVTWWDFDRGHIPGSCCDCSRLSGAEVRKKEFEVIRAWLSTLMESKASVDGTNGK